MTGFISYVLLATAMAVIYFSSKKYRTLADIDRQGLAALSLVMYLMGGYAVLSGKGPLSAFDYTTALYSYAVARPLWPLALFLVRDFPRNSLKMYYATFVTVALMGADVFFVLEFR